jgi:hypothetical protein
METDKETNKRPPILELAWQLHAEMDLAADKLTLGFFKIRKWIAWLGILATLFAILTQQLAPDPVPTSLEAWVIKLFFIAIPIIASIIAAFATKFYSNGAWLIYRAGAEEIKKEIYTYRTILPRDNQRRDYLTKKLDDIQRKVFRNLGGEYAIEEYNGPLPSSFDKKHPLSDPGFHDLTGDEYVKYRVKHQLDWHNGRIQRRRRERRLMTIAILVAGGVGALLAALGGFLAIWVAITASITAALLGWQELKKVDETIKNYSKVVLELNIIHDHWQGLEVEERTQQEFEKMVLGCERVLWTQNREFIRSMQEAIRSMDLEKDAAIINDTLKKSVESAERAKEQMQEEIGETFEKTLIKTEQKVRKSAKALMGTLTEEAASEVVQQELEAMGKALTERFENVRERASSLVSSITQVKEELKDVEVSKDITAEELNAILARYPKTNDVKG